MKKNILWIDDDYYTIQGLSSPLKRAGYNFDVATNVVAAYEKGLNWKKYDCIVVDIILPTEQDVNLPVVVSKWQSGNEHLGICIVKWLLNELTVRCPVIILSVIANPISVYNIEHIGVAKSIQKGGLLPSRFTDELYEVLKVDNRTEK